MSERSQERSVTTDLGIRIIYDDVGDTTSAEVLLFIPGALGFASSDYAPQVAELGKHFRVLAMDPRGYGRSRPPQRDFPLDFLRREAQDAVAVAEHALRGGCAGQVTVCGWSDGANAAVLFAAERPDLTKRVVMWGGNAFVTQQDVDLYRAEVDTSHWPSEMSAPLIDVYGAEGLQSMWTAWIEAMDAIRRDVPDGDICKAEAGMLSAPVLMLHGEVDEYIPRSHVDFFLSAIKPQPKFIAFPEGKHDVHLSHSELFNAAVREFCTT